MGQIGAVAIRDLNKLFLDLIMGNRLLFLEHYRPKKKKKRNEKEKNLSWTEENSVPFISFIFSLQVLWW